MSKRTTVVRLKSSKDKENIKDYIYKYRHFENMLLILIKNNYHLYKEKEDVNDFKHLTNFKVMRAVIRGTRGGKEESKVSYIREKYKDNELMKDLLLLGKELKVHNLSMIIRRIKGQYKTYFSKLKKDDNANPPKAKKLSKLREYSIPLDVNGWSLKQEDLLGINLNDKMFYVHVEHCNLKKVVKNLDNIKSVTIHYSNSEIYLHFVYKYEEAELPERETKYAAIDMGIKNLSAIFIDDEKSPSLIIDGKDYKAYNSDFNRMTGKLSRTIDTLKNQLKENKENKSLSREATGSVTGFIVAGGSFLYSFLYLSTHSEKIIEKRIKYLINYRRFLYEKRNRYFKDQFHKISKRILEYLSIQGVSDLVLSRNLADLKNNGEVKLGKSNTQQFIQIPLIKLLDYIEYKAVDYGIRIHIINEAYTSKVSPLSDDIIEIQKNPSLANDINGYRAKRGLFKDKLLDKIWNSDTGSAVNFIKIAFRRSFNWLKDYMFKLCNPIKLRSDRDLVLFIRKLTDTGSDKVNCVLTAS